MVRFFGEKLKHLRHQRSMTQVEMARQIGLESHSHIAKLEGGDAPSLSTVLGIARLLNISTDYLLRDTIPVEAPVPSLAGSTSDDQLTPFGARLRALRLQHQLSQRDLARTLGLASRAYIGGLEADRGKLPSLELVVRMADLFGVTIDDLLRGVTPPSRSSADSGNE
jgi:transcriptional regulator with XRE-family HTH domain